MSLGYIILLISSLFFIIELFSGFTFILSFIYSISGILVCLIFYNNFNKSILDISLSNYILIQIVWTIIFFIISLVFFILQKRNNKIISTEDNKIPFDLLNKEAKIVSTLDNNKYVVSYAGTTYKCLSTESNLSVNDIAIMTGKKGNYIEIKSISK